MATTQSEIGIRITAKDEASATIGKVGSGLGTLKNAIALTAGYAGFRGLESAARSAVSFLKSSVEEYKKSEEVTTKLTTLILNQKNATMENVRALKEQAQQIQQVTTYSDDLVMVAQAQLATFDLTSESIQKILPGFIDMVAAEKGATISAEEMKSAAQGLGKALVGQTDTLVKQGFLFTDLQKEILKTGDVTERLQVITDVMGKTYAGTASALAESYTGKLIQMQNSLSDLQETIGAFVSFAMANMMQSFIDATGGVQNFGQVAVQIGKTVAMSMMYAANAVAFLASKISAATSLIRGFKAAAESGGLISGKGRDAFMEEFTAPNLGDTMDKFIQENMKAIENLSSMSEAPQSGIPQFANGGIVPGTNGMPRLIVAHGGETVLPTHRNTTINLGGITINNEVDSRNFLNKLSGVLGGNIENARLGLR